VRSNGVQIGLEQYFVFVLLVYAFYVVHFLNFLFFIWQKQHCNNSYLLSIINNDNIILETKKKINNTNYSLHNYYWPLLLVRSFIKYINIHKYTSILLLILGSQSDPAYELTLKKNYTCISSFCFAISYLLVC
jgi:hypothetical protein